MSEAPVEIQKQIFSIFEVVSESISLRDDKEGDVESPEQSFEQDEVPIEVERIICKAPVSILGQNKPETSIILNQLKLQL